jgi:hypothetical protein
MSATITVNFGAQTQSVSAATVALGNATVSLSPEGGVSCAFSTALNNFWVWSNYVMFGSEGGAQFTGSVSIGIVWASGATPTVTISSLTTAGAPAMVTWPTASGPATQVLTPNTPMPLNGIVSS